MTWWLRAGLLALMLTVGHSLAAEQEFAELGDFPLASGATLKDLRLGYRQYGDVAGKPEQVVVLLSWFGGQTEQLEELIGPDRLLDPAQTPVIAIDALADGVSSSPSNRTTQPRMQFPEIRIADMVQSSRRLLTDVFKLKRVKAVIGMSMGGMQVFEWLTHDPDFAERGIVIQGSPRLTPYDLLLWQSTIEAIKLDPVWQQGDYTEQPARRALYYIATLAGQSPTAINRAMSRPQVLALLDRHDPVQGFDANDHIRQVEAMLYHDVARLDDGDLSRAAKRVKAPLLYLWNATDTVVRPEPGLEFAKAAKAEVVELPGDCGHGAFACEMPKVVDVVQAFLAKPLTADKP